mgnify:CR=1 FL=1
MATIVTMPRLSDTMTEGTVATWLKKVGDKVSEGDILAEIETDKATMEFESFNEGTLLHIGIPAGETAPVDSLLAIIGNEGEDISALLAGGAATAAATCRCGTGNCVRHGPACAMVCQAHAGLELAAHRGTPGRALQHRSAHCARRIDQCSGPRATGRAHPPLADG